VQWGAKNFSDFFKILAKNNKKYTLFLKGKMMGIISIKDIVEEEAESDNRYYAVKKPVELFCGLYSNNILGKFEVYIGETMKINEYLNWIKKNKI
jgi:hypothetical protein